MEFRIIFSLHYSININTFEVDPPSDSLHNALVKPKNSETTDLPNLGLDGATSYSYNLL
jgi:hypothetical protein